MRKFGAQEATEKTESMVGRKSSAVSATSVSSCSKEYFVSANGRAGPFRDPLRALRDSVVKSALAENNR
jgi:hypothetical protein